MNQMQIPLNIYSKIFLKKCNIIERSKFMIKYYKKIKILNVKFKNSWTKMKLELNLPNIEI